MLINFDWILIICQRHSLIFEFTWIIFYILIVTLWCRVPFHRCGNWGLGRFGTLTKITQVVSSVTEIQDNVVYIAACSLSVLHLTLVSCSVAKSCPTVCDPMGCSRSGFPVPHHLLEFAQVHVHCLGDAIQPSHLLSPSSFAFSLSQHQGLFQWVSSSHQVAKILELQLQHQSFQWVFRVDFL